MPQSLRSIGNYAFYKNDLAALVIPAGVVEVGYYAFRGNPRLERVCIEAPEENIEIEHNTFDKGSSSSTPRTAGL